MRVLLIVALLLLSPVAWAQQQPSWEDIAMQAQRNAASDQMLSVAAIAALQKEIEALKAEIAKSQPKPAPPAK
jgi:hypothetical protein